MMNKTKTQIENEVLEKYKRISDKKKKQHLENRKKSLLKFYILLSCAALLISVLSVITAVLDREYRIEMIILGIFSFLATITLIILMVVKLKSSEEKLIIEQLKKVLTKTYASLNYEGTAKYRTYVKQHSLMYKNTKELNSKYQFDRIICKEHKYRENLNSKRQFDKFDYEKWILGKIKESPAFFDKFQKIYEDNANKYKNYLVEYNKLQNYRTEIEIEDLNIEFEIFNYLEKELFEENKHERIEKPSISVFVSYTSPSGRNSYSNNYYFSYNELIKFVEKNNAEKERILEEKRTKETLTQKKREKERRLKELDKFEKQLTEKEQKLSEKEKEFIEATKEHIYTSKSIVRESNFELEEGSSLTEKLKFLRKRFDNGEITYDEYKNKRKELM